MDVEIILLSVFTSWIFVLAAGTVVAFRICRKIYPHRKDQPFGKVVKTCKLEVLWAGIFSMDTSMVFFNGILAMLRLYPWKVCNEVIGENIAEMNPPIDMKCCLYILVECVGSGLVVAVRYSIVLEQWCHGTDDLTEPYHNKLLPNICTKVTMCCVCAIVVAMLMLLYYILNPSAALEEHAHWSPCWEEMSRAGCSAAVPLLFAAHAVACTIGYVTYGKYKSIHDTERGEYKTIVQGGLEMCQTKLDSDHTERMAHICDAEVSVKSSNSPRYLVEKLRRPDTKSPASWFTLLLVLYSFWAAVFPVLLFFSLVIANRDVDHSVYLLLWMYGSSSCFWSFLLYICLPRSVSQ